MNQRELIAGLPLHLQPFVREQGDQDYTSRDQAVWRFTMRQLIGQLRDSAHPVYLEGLRRTGISPDHIPSIDEMNTALAELGWRAVMVEGFIPPAIFMEFQALKILVIARQMRSVEHIFYTPAPDILHESAGHAPFIIDVDYAEFLQSFGKVGMKAIANRDDLDSYEAIRQLSVLKENPQSSKDEIAAAQARLAQLSDRQNPPSEAALLSRLHWWTVEYGLVGAVEDYRIFGAGLLSSLGESQQCLDDERVSKLPLTVNAVETAYDITREQPQLFVTPSCKHLSQVLEEFAASMSFRTGGTQGLNKAIEAASICTACYDSGVQVSGVFDEVLCDAVGNPIYLHTDGPTQLAYMESEIIGHGVDYHAQGFGSPIGHLKNFSRCLSEYTIDELRAHDIAIGQVVQLDYLSGISVKGVLDKVHRQDHRNLLLSFSACEVTDLHGRVLFDPAWGNYDLAVGASICSVYGGVADRQKLQLHRPLPGPVAARPIEDEVLMNAYELVDALRRGDCTLADDALDAALQQALEKYPDEWLLRAELLTLATDGWQTRLCRELIALGAQNEELARLTGLAMQEQIGQS